MRRSDVYYISERISYTKLMEESNLSWKLMLQRNVKGVSVQWTKHLFV